MFELKEFMFEERFAPHLFAGELITPQATLVRQPTFYGAVKALWNRNSADDFSTVRWYEDSEEGIVLTGTQDILVIKPSWHPNRFFVKWTIPEAEDTDILMLGWLVETANGEKAWFPSLSELFEYQQFCKRNPDATVTRARWYGNLFNF